MILGGSSPRWQGRTARSGWDGWRRACDEPKLRHRDPHAGVHDCSRLRQHDWVRSISRRASSRQNRHRSRVTRASTGLISRGCKVRTWMSNWKVWTEELKVQRGRAPRQGEAADARGQRPADHHRGRARRDAHRCPAHGRESRGRWWHPSPLQSARRARRRSPDRRRRRDDGGAVTGSGCRTDRCCAS